MNSALRIASLCTLALAVCSCGNEKTADQRATAGGEILPGSASDAMLPYDTVRSQPPIVVPTSASTAPGEQAPSDAASAAAGSPDATASSAPASQTRETTSPSAD